MSKTDVLTKTDLIEAIATHPSIRRIAEGGGPTRKSAAKVAEDIARVAVESLEEVTREALVLGRGLNLRGVLRLDVAPVAERLVRLPSGEQRTIPAHRTVKARVSDALKAKVAATPA